MSGRCIVVGAGVVGASTSLRLAQSGVDVTLLDADSPGAGTSGTTFAWVGASALGLWDYFDLNLAGVAAYRRLRAELGVTPWFSSSGSLVWCSDAAAEAQLVDRVGELRAAGYSARLITRDQAAELEPDVVFGRSVERVAFYSDEGYAFPRPMIAELLRLARERGVTTRWGARVVGLDESPGAASVRLESGERLEAETVVICCGRWTGELAGLAGMEIPMVPGIEPGSLAIGLLVLTSPAVQGVRRLLFPDDVMIRPDGGGRLLLHSDEHDRMVDPAAPGERHAEIADEVVETASGHLALGARLTAAQATVGIRALTADLLPAVGRLPGRSRIYAAVTHSGITLAPLLGELIAAEIVTEEDEPLLQPFRPSRFASLAVQGDGARLAAGGAENIHGEVAT